jgi:hypothetical protein
VKSPFDLYALSYLRMKLGEIDEAERLRIAIITGIDKKKPYSYAVSISTNQESIGGTSQNQFVSVSRSHRMHPPNLHNLNSFLEYYNSVGRFFIVPSHFKVLASNQICFGTFELANNRSLFERHGKSVRMTQILLYLRRVIAL